MCANSQQLASQPCSLSCRRKLVSDLYKQDYLLWPKSIGEGLIVADMGAREWLLTQPWLGKLFL